MGRVSNCEYKITATSSCTPLQCLYQDTPVTDQKSCVRFQIPPNFHEDSGFQSKIQIPYLRDSMHCTQLAFY